MADGHQWIPLVVGTKFTVPTGMVLERAYSRPLVAADSLHPHVIRVAKSSKKGFKFYRRHHARGFVLLVPEGCLGRELQLIWAEQNCICAAYPKQHDRTDAAVATELYPTCCG